MRQEIKLYIGNQEVEFSTPPEILYNYTLTDLKNPTIYKNSFSKQITIEGTPKNNQLFGSIWNLQRIQAYGNGSTGVSFNPLQKADFKIYVNGDLYESGYVKLSNVVRTGNDVQYEINLFGGLGQFFYNLSYTHNEAGEAEGPDKLQLKDLDFILDHDMINNIEFVINKDTMWDALCAQNGFSPGVDDESQADRPNNFYKNPLFYASNGTSFINFIPTAYNGIPEDFDAQHVLINSPSTYNGVFATSSGGGTTIGGYALGAPNQALTQEETRDLRSYLQRPIINMAAIIQSCGLPQNNGGYELKLGRFFNSDNPYYREAYMTLPMLKDLEIDKTTDYTITGATISASGTTAQRIAFTQPTGSTLNNFQITIDARFTLNATPSYYPQMLFTDTYFTGEPVIFSDDVKDYMKRGTQMLQLIAFDETNTPIAESNVVMLQSAQYEGNTVDNTYSAYKDLWNAAFPSDVSVPAIDVRQGCYRRLSGNIYYWTEGTTAAAVRRGVTFTFPQSMQNFHHLVLKHLHPANEWWKTRTGLFSYYNGNAKYDTDPIGLFSSMRSRSTLSVSLDDVRKRDNYRGSYSFAILNFKAEATIYEGFFSGTKITKDKLLATDDTPASYLINYCKLFGLYFYRDAAETSDDPETYPNGVIHILDRGEFYKMVGENGEEKEPEIINLEKVIDRSKPMSITPQIPETKWYDFNVEQLETDAENKYFATYEIPLGLKRVNTGYNFDAEATDVYKDNLFRGAPMVQEKDKYYYVGDMSGKILPYYVYNGMKYNLFKSNGGNYENVELYPIQKTHTKRAYNSGNTGYDIFPRLQLHGPDNKAIEGDGVLVFRIGDKSCAINSGLTAPYWVTDDLNYMGTLNGGEPCWIMTDSVYNYNGTEKIAYPLNNLPYYSRIIVNSDTNYTTLSWDFGNSQEVFIPNVYNTDEQGIYSRCWGNYIKDLYSVNNRKLTCSVLLKEKPNPDWLRRFYWFDGCIWALNKIKDWSVSTYDSTEMEFIKVQDIDNYKFGSISDRGIIRLFYDLDVFPWDDVEVTGRVTSSDGGWWSFYGDRMITAEYIDGTSINVEDDPNVYVTPNGGSGLTTTFVLHTGENDDAKPRRFYLTIENNENVFDHYPVLQEGNGDPYVALYCSAYNRTFRTMGPTAKKIDIPVFMGGGINTYRFEIIGDMVDRYKYAGDEHGGTLSVWVKANTDETSSGRTAEVYLYGEDGVTPMTFMSHVSISQTGPSFEISTNSVVFEYNETSSKAVEFTPHGSEYGYSAYLDDPDDAFSIYLRSWGEVSIYPKGANYGDTDHNATIIITNGITSKEIEVTQKGDAPATYASVTWPWAKSDNYYVFGAAGGTNFRNAEVYADGRWFVTVSATWAHATTTGANSFKLSVDKNTGGERTFDVRVINKNGNILATKRYTQKAAP